MPRRRQSKRVSTSPYARQGAVLPDSGPMDAVAAPGVGMPEVSMPATDSTTAPPAVVPAMSGDQFAELIAVVQQGIVAGTSQMDLPVVAGGNVAPVESVNTPIGIHVPLSIRQKIVNGEYVDLGSLLATNHSKQSSSIQVVRGRIEVTQKANTVRINTLDQWSDAFIIFISIYITAHPNAVQGLLKYFSNIRLGASRGVDLGWKAYDEQFRLKMAQNPGSDWGTIESELWLLYMYSSPAAPAQSPPAGKQLKCIPFNNTGRCVKAHCTYLHKCATCNGDHSAFVCSLTSTFRLGQQRFPVERPSLPYVPPRPRGPFTPAYRGSPRGPVRTPNPRFYTHQYR